MPKEKNIIEGTDKEACRRVFYGNQEYEVKVAMNSFEKAEKEAEERAKKSLIEKAFEKLCHMGH